MDFFENQARAHRKTKWLLIYFVFAVVSIIVTLQLAAAFAFGESPANWQMLSLISAGVVIIVSAGAIYRIVELSHGGGAVAQMLGGQQLAPNTTDFREIQFRNVVEEMALASGVPVPDIYVLNDESGINAFAAGNTPGDAVVAVTRGTLERLTRDELQGVVAHEFSHILNGDMRLNLRLIGILNGILLLAILGRLVFEIGSRSGSRSDSKNSSALPLFAMGAALWLIGSIGVFFAKLIKAAVSRQREFLADASAVQFTRNPNGISGALYKIGQLTSRLQSPRADEASHLFFGNGLKESSLGWFATHPPIDERIKAINPAFDFAQIKAAPSISENQPSKPASTPTLPGVVMLASLPEFARNATRETASAVPLIYALLLSKNETTRVQQLAVLELNPEERAELDREVPRSAEIPDAVSMMDLCLPALRQLSKPQYTKFRENVRNLIACDGEIDLFEFVLHKALVRHVDHYFTKNRGPSVRYRSVLPLLPDIVIVLSMLASRGTTSESRQEAFQTGIAALMLKPGTCSATHLEANDFTSLEAALDRIAEADLCTRRKILNACNQAARQDGVIHPQEAAILRAISDVLACPTLHPENRV